MNENVIIKSFPHGLLLKLSDTEPIEDLLREICYKFASSRNFFGEAEMVLSIEGRKLSEEERIAVVQSIEYNSDIKITVISDNDNRIDYRFLRMLNEEKEKYIDNNAKIVFSIDENEDEIISESSIVVLGNVPEGVTLRSIGNIIVTGALYGKAYAGFPGRKNCFIAAGLLDAELLNIGGEDYEKPKAKGFFSKKKSAATVLTLSGSTFYENEFGDVDLLGHINGKA